MDGLMVATMTSHGWTHGFTDPPLYFWKVNNSVDKVCCIAYVNIPESDEHPNWRLDKSWEEGFEFADTIETTALAALMELCKRNKIEIGTSPTRYFPIRNQEDGTWKHRVKALKNKSRVESDVIAAASTDI